MEAKAGAKPVPTSTSERLHALDAVRAGALLLGLVIHAAMSFLPGEQVWVIRDQESSGIGLLFYVPHIFRMSLFFLIAGFFGRMSFHRRGLGSFVRDRLKRIGIPLVTFWPILFGAFVGILIWGVTLQHGPGAVEHIPSPEGTIFETFPLTHLWFLYVLLLLYAGTLGVRGVVAAVDGESRLRGGVDRWVRTLLRSGLAPLALAAPTALALYARPDWLMWLGVPSPDHGLIPNAPALAAFGTAFAFGWLLQRQARELRVLEGRWLPHLVVAVGLSAACLAISGVSVTLDASSQAAAGDPVLRAILATCYPLATWAWSFGLVGLALRYLSGPSPAIRYVADSSYWVYLVHLPVIMVAQVLLFPVALPAVVKYVLVLATTLPLLLLSYHLLVRYSFLGALLNGRRHERRRKEEGEPALVTAPR